LVQCSTPSQTLSLEEYSLGYSLGKQRTITAVRAVSVQPPDMNDVVDKRERVHQDDDRLRYKRPQESRENKSLPTGKFSISRASAAMACTCRKGRSRPLKTKSYQIILCTGPDMARSDNAKPDRQWWQTHLMSLRHGYCNIPLFHTDIQRKVKVSIGLHAPGGMAHPSQSCPKPP
jgi:hypothetical protein